MSQTQKVGWLMQKMVKTPPLKALSLFNSSTQQTQDSATVILQILLSSNLLVQAQSLLLQLISGRLSSVSFSPSSLLSSSTSSTLLLVYDAIVNAYVQSQMPEQSLFYLKEMINRSLVPRSNTFNAVLTLLFNSNLFEQAWLVFNETTNKDSHSFGIMIKGCCQVGHVIKGFEILAQMLEMGFSPTVVIYTSLIDGCCKKGDIEEANKLFIEMGSLGLVPNEVTYTVMINGYFKKGFKKEGLELYEEMKVRGVNPNMYTYNSVLNQYCKDGNVSKAFRMFGEMREKGVARNVVTSGNMEKAFELHLSMEKAGVITDVYTYGVLIHGLCITGNMKDALKLFRLMSEKQLNPNDVIYNTMIYGYCKQDSSYRALRLLKEMREKGMIPNMASYGLTISVLCKDGKWQEGEDLLNEMVTSGLRPSDSIYSTISKARNKNTMANILKTEGLKDARAPMAVSFSSRGPNPIIKASGKYSRMSGTSMSCPHASGAAAYVKTSCLIGLQQMLNFFYGSGHIDPVKAIIPGLVYDLLESDHFNMLCGVGFTTKPIKAISGHDSSVCSGASQTTSKGFPWYLMLEAPILRGLSPNVGVANSAYEAIIGSPTNLRISVRRKVLPFKSLHENQSLLWHYLQVLPRRAIVSLGSPVCSDGIHTIRSPIYWLDSLVYDF
ncbi:hypothetical protein IFM89_036592 [Coptis chinensis]|uniref:Peptidase S8/S53 domain-containing protein n=1 Tax=Coptis chinensis TaxID=261450 RepID=A0A835HH29_9MAGN|nr:hypothetical protein IFM89_036592 [Coptis chinensis]